MNLSEAEAFVARLISHLLSKAFSVASYLAVLFYAWFRFHFKEINCSKLIRILLHVVEWLSRGLNSYVYTLLCMEFLCLVIHNCTIVL